MRWTLHLNRPHVALIWRALQGWLLFVGLGIVVGWRYRPRLDEIAFLTILPLFVLGPYIAFCLVASAVKLLWLARHQYGAHLRLRFLRNNRLWHKP